MSISNSVTIDGVEYIPKSAAGNIKIIVLDRGFVYVGRVQELDDRIEVARARCIIRWGTTGHLGELFNGPLEGTKLGDYCSFTAYKSSVIHMINVSADMWTEA